MFFYVHLPIEHNQKNMSAKKKKASGGPLWFIVIAVLLGTLTYKYQAQEEAPTVENQQTEKSIRQPVANKEGLEIPVMHLREARAGGQILKRTGYTASYNADYKTPHWVAWELTKKETQGKETRTDKFLPDPDVLGAKAYTTDYTNSGYDRGHMAPAADMKWSRQAMEESFYLSNICPQNPNLNRGDWNDLEEQSRQWAKKYGRIYIVCGPIYDSKRPKRIGNNKVAVPDAFYKVILVNDKKDPKAIGFIFPNKAGSKPLERYAVSVDSVEKRTDIDFFPALPDEVEDRIEAVSELNF